MVMMDTYLHTWTKTCGINVNNLVYVNQFVLDRKAALELHCWVCEQTWGALKCWSFNERCLHVYNCARIAKDNR